MSQKSGILPSVPAWLGPIVVVHILLQTGFADPHVLQGKTAELDTQPALWLVSTRNAPYCNPSEHGTSCLEYWHFDADRTWRRSRLEELLSTDDPEITTLIYVHENRVTRSESFQRSRQMMSLLCRTSAAEKRFRLVMISWPADRIGWRPRPDAQAKAQRSQAHSYYLAWLIDQMDPDVPISLMGMSYGPRMIVSALHLLGGGTIHGQPPLPRLHPERRPVRAALTAAAIDSHSLAPGQRHGNALTQVEHMLVTVNRRDTALRWYPRLYGRGGPQAMGYVGPSGGACSGAIRDQVFELDVSCHAGSNHSWRVYEGSPKILAMIVPHLFADDEKQADLSGHESTSSQQRGAQSATMHGSAATISADGVIPASFVRSP